MANEKTDAARIDEMVDDFMCREAMTKGLQEWGTLFEKAGMSAANMPKKRSEFLKEYIARYLKEN
jgi:hypothetical protein